ncbi:hypothetical protein ACDX78_05310 [Virgibacillus oceani]
MSDKKRVQKIKNTEIKKSYGEALARPVIKPPKKAIDRTKNK